MKLPRHHSIRKESAQYLLLALPTIALMAYGIFMANQWLALLNNNWVPQSLAFAGGILLSIFCFARRFRFITLSLVLVLIFYLIRLVVQLILPDEFDSFFFIVLINNLFTLFAAGWIAGYGFSRSRFFTIWWAVMVLATLILVIASITVPLRNAIFTAIIPVLVYAAYIIYTGEFIRNMNEDQTGFKWFIGRRLIGFAMLLTIVMGIAIMLLKTDFSAIEKEWEHGGKPKENNERQNSLTRNDGMGITTQNSMGLQGFNNRANKDSLLFVAKLENFFPDGETPNPLYFVSDYYTRFDTLTQTFEIDTLRPYNDLFQPDLLSLPLYFTFQDTTVLNNSLSNLNRKITTAEVYKTSLSPRHFTAPSTAFFVQPISVPEENKEIYKSAYRTKMMVSDLNSAYFVYNPAGDAELAYFQEQRFAALRTVNDFESAPREFIEYYTEMPEGESYDSIRTLANIIVDSVENRPPVDKVIALRNFFLATDSAGNPTFRYSDNPGIPGLPSANKLCHFLFDSKKGYCAYYAGSTLFLLRALGIPSRIATGFLTVDRSNKNPGWFWFYEDQAHAWVQVWFPGYGWLDFDTTVPSTESQEAPQPDQTPPLTSQTAWLVANGKVITVDTIAKRVAMQVTHVLYWDSPWELKAPQSFELDVSMARIIKDTGQVTLQTLQKGMDIVAVSFSEQFKEIPAQKEEKWESLYKRWPAPLPIDEIKIIALDDETKKEIKTAANNQIPWRNIFGWIALAFAGLLFLSLLIPFIIYKWFSFRASSSENLSAKAYHSYMASLFYLHQLGYKRLHQTPMQFAYTNVDPKFGTSLSNFINIYQKLKYSKNPLTEKEEIIITNHLSDFTKNIHQKIPFGSRFKAFLKPALTLEFFTQPNILGSSKK